VLRTIHSDETLSRRSVFRDSVFLFDRWHRADGTKYKGKPITTPNNKPVAEPNVERKSRTARSELNSDDFAALNDVAGEDSKATIFDSEKELFRELLHALRTIRYGSIVLTVHEGQLVEINKSIRIRKSRPNQKE
jgi:hypothetical protein